MKRVALLLMFISTPVLAQSWLGTGELGFISASGNTDSQTLNSKLDVTQKSDKWSHAAGVTLLKSSTDNVESANSLIFTEKSDYSFSEKAYVFAGLRFEDDKFSGYENQSSIAAGMGSRFIDNKEQALDLSAGLGLRQIKPIADKRKNDAIINLQAKYFLHLSEHASVVQDVLFELGDSNTHSESSTALKMKIAGNLSSVISYIVKKNSNVPTGVKKTDAITTVSLAYDF